MGSAISFFSNAVSYCGKSANQNPTLSSEMLDLLDKLDSVKKNMSDKLAEWEKIHAALEKEILAVSPESIFDPVSVTRENIVPEYCKIFQKIFEHACTHLRPAESEIQELISVATENLKLRISELSHACAISESTDINITDIQRLQARFEVASACVGSIRLLVTLVDDIKKAVESDVRDELILEDAAGAVVRVALAFLVKIPLPDLGFSMNTTWQNFLADILSDEVIGVGDLARIVASTLEMAGDKIIKSDSHEHEIPSNRENSLVSSQGYFSSNKSFHQQNANNPVQTGTELHLSPSFS